MPTYEYRCKDCGHQFEAQQSFTDDALTECPECSGVLKKKFGSVGISFKGSGFYKNDSGGSSGGSGSSSSTTATTSEAASSSTSSDSSSTSATTSAASTSGTTA